MKSVGRRLGEREFTIIDQLRLTIDRLGCTPGQVALAWVCGRRAYDRPLRQAVAALDVTLDDGAVHILNDVSRLQRLLPHNVLSRVWGTSHGGLTIGERYFKPSGSTPKGVNSLG